MAGPPNACRSGALGPVWARAVGLAEPGGVVLLSPGYKNFDWFISSEDSGRRFKDIVRAWHAARAC